MVKMSLSLSFSEPMASSGRVGLESCLVLHPGRGAKSEAAHLMACGAAKRPRVRGGRPRPATWTCAFIAQNGAKLTLGLRPDRSRPKCRIPPANKRLSCEYSRAQRYRRAGSW